MPEKLPITRMNRLSWLLSIIIGIIFYIIISHNAGPGHIYPFTFFTVLGIVLIGYIDVGIMIILSKRFGIKSHKFRLYRYLLGYPPSVLVYFVVWPIIARLAGVSWSYQDINTALAFIGSGIVINTMIILMHDSVLLYEHKLYAELELSKLKTANAEASNLLLKQQIHPHFLFNALNTLKALYHKDTQIADNYIVHMAGFLRASIYHQSHTISKLKDEVNILNDYLEMQRIRFATALDCRINLADEILDNRYLPSFSLQPLLENAIKHNNFTLQAPLSVNIIQEADWLVISNNIQKRNITIASTHYGLANLAERYRLCSGDEIVITENDHTFSVSIKLLNHEDRNH
jgi:two-component system LytT family sensor kinase